MLLPLYRLTYRLRQRWQKNFSPAKNKYLYPFTGKPLVHIGVILLIFFVTASNLHARTVPNTGGQGSILYALIGGEENEIIEETANTGSEETISYLGDYYGIAAKQDVLSDVAAIPVSESVALVTTGGVAVAALPSLTGERQVVPARLNQPRDRSEKETYIVKAGDSIGVIATAFGISSNTILWANDLGPRDYIRPGQELEILPITGIEHTIEKGDTISKIAKKYDVDSEKVVSYNSLEEGQLVIGKDLIIPEGVKPRAPAPSYTRIAQQPSISRIADVIKPVQTPSPDATASGMIWPTSGRVITQYWGWRHTGIDIDDDRPGAPIYASHDGIVNTANYMRGYGNQVTIKDPSTGIMTRYAHMAPGTMAVRAGQAVKKGQVIGIVGTTGFSTGTHLHFEVYVNGVRRNPLLYVR